MVIVSILGENERCFLKNDNKICINIYSGRGETRQDVASKTYLCPVTS